MLTRSHGLGNDYLVCDPAELPLEITPERVRLICDRHEGVGSDGLLVLHGERGVRIFNPDGSEAEKSGNGLRIFARWLYDTHRVMSPRFAIDLAGGASEVAIDTASGDVTVDMGIPTFRDDLTDIDVSGQRLRVTAVSIGNPHCVVLRETLDPAELRRLGPLVEQHAAFPNRTNVQLARATDRAHVELLIWERGAGETRASGSSSTAVVAACQKLGLVDDDVTARMPGGELRIQRGADARLWLTGPVQEICRIQISPDLMRRLHALP